MKKILLFTLFIMAFVASYGQSTKKIKVYGLCGMCKDKIESTALNNIGVSLAVWTDFDQMLEISYDENLFVETELHKSLAAIGYDTELEKADDEVYNNLPMCCQYRTVDDSEGQNNENSVISGSIYESTPSGKLQPLIGANVYYVDASTGTATDEGGYFQLVKNPDGMPQQIVISYIGYVNDTIDMTGQSMVSITMKSNFVLDEVQIKYRKKATEVTFINPIKVHSLTQKEFQKAACCNLAESFETSPSVDASATDAVTGTRKIEMLGLAGPYVQVTRENMPYIRGLAALYGFAYTPGPWLESVQLNMGTGSVVNGPESMTGQINVEIKKPDLSEKLYLNLYANAAGRYEANVNTSAKVNERWHTGLLAHANRQRSHHDRNFDTFQDMPDNNSLILMNRWKYSSDNGVHGQFGIKGTYIDNSSGQLVEHHDIPGFDKWRADIKTKRMEGWIKRGKVFTDRPYASLGIQLAGSIHDQQSTFGLKTYNANQTSLYANVIYQSIIKNLDNVIKVGSSAQYDKFNEDVVDNNYIRSETMAGIFAEYQYTSAEKLTIVAGLRGDYHDDYGAFLTPRFHLRYNLTASSALRFIAGMGRRTASIFAENIGLFASNRAIVLSGSDPSVPYGLNQEKATNIGVNFTKELVVNGKSMIVGLDYYYTSFQDQVVVDYDLHPQEVHFYNLAGKSYAHSVQAQLDAEVIEGLDIRLAYRYNNPKTDYIQGNNVRPLIAKHRSFFNIAWEIGKGWTADYTANWQSSKRIPDTRSNPEAYRFEEYSPSFITMNAQVTKKIGQKIEVYLGGENLSDYRQERAILSFENPFDEYFDSSMIWGPIQGRMIYVGLRMKLVE